MSVYFYSTVWVFAENPSDLDLITDEKMIEFACVPRNSPNEGESWLTEARKERAGKIEKRTSNVMKIHAGGKYGHCMPDFEISKLCPNFLLIVTDGADCNDYMTVSFVKNTKRLKCINVDFLSKEIIPNVLSFKDFETIDFVKIKSIFDNIETYFFNELSDNFGFWNDE